MSLAVALFALSVLGSSIGQKPESYEWNGSLARNPVLPGYFADPCVRKFGDTYYLYVTPDGWDVGKGPFCIWTSKDFVHWKSHKSNWPTTDFKWAPSLVEKDGRYYMYTQTPCMVWGAVADTPLGPWKSLAPEGLPIILDQTPKGSIVLDGECFIDTDGQIYMWYSTWWTPTLAKLKNDMHTIDGQPRQYFKSVTTPNPEPGYTVQGCMEAPYMLKRNGVYYLMYSNNFCQDHTYQVEYSVAPTPWGPFTYGKNNPILSTNADDTVDGPGHHSILEDNGKVYIVYHRHDNPHHPDGAHRQVAIDELHFLPDGSIEKVVPTHAGVGYLAPSTVRDTNLALKATAKASSTAGRFFMPENVADENNGTLWKAKEYKYPQWLTLDLGKVSRIARVETEFQFAQIGYRYVYEVSNDGKRWSIYADRRNNHEWGPMVDKRASPARYLRLTILGDDAPQRPIKEIAVWNIKVYDGIDKPNRAPTVSAGPSRTLSIGNPKALLQGSVDDDGLPYGPVKVSWSVVSAPGKVVIEHPDRLTTHVAFSRLGKYVLKLTADDGKLKGSNTVQFTVVPQGENLMKLDFDETYGNLARDKTPNGNDGIVKVGAKRTIGVKGQAFKLSTDHRIDVPTLKRAGDFTISAWINLHELRPNAAIAVLGDRIALTIQPDGEVALVIAGKIIAKSGPIFTRQRLGQWVHLVVAANQKAGSVSFFANGAAAGKDGRLDIPLPDTSGMRLGGDGFIGELDEVSLIGRSLGTEAAAAYNRYQIETLKQMLARPDGSRVRVLAKTATYAPFNIGSNERATPFFYIGDETGGIKVDDSAFQGEPVTYGCRYSFEAVIRTEPSGERVLVPTGEPSQGSLSELQPREGVWEAGSYAIARGVCGSPRGDGFDLTVGSEKIKIAVAPGATLPRFAEGNEVEVLGVVRNSGSKKTLLMSDMKRINPPDDGLLVRYTFDSIAEGKALDSSGNGYDGELMGGARTDSGKRGQAVLLNGTDAYIQMPKIGLHRAMTMTAWIKVLGLNANEWSMSIFHRPSWKGGDPHMQVMNGSGCVRLAVNGNVPEVIDSRFSFKDRLGEWVHVAVVYDSAARKSAIYINGRKDSEAEFSVARALNLEELKLGCWGPEPRFLKGLIDDFRIYRRALSQDEIGRMLE